MAGFGLATSAALAAPDIPVHIELVLAVDVSSSIDDGEFNLQRLGYLEALTDARLIEAITSSSFRRVAITYVEWAQTQRIVVGWILIEDLESASVFAAAIAAIPPIVDDLTSVSGAIDFTSTLFANNGFEGTRQVIDLSSDGRNFAGRPVAAARDDAFAQRITINALPIAAGSLAAEGLPH